MWTLKQMAFASIWFYLSPQSVFVSFDALLLSRVFLKLLISVSAAEFEAPTAREGSNLQSVVPV